MKKGGYKIIDLKGTSLSGTPVTIDGVYELIEGNYGKAVMISGINIGGTEKPDAYVQFTVDSGSYVGEIYGKILTITSDDEISVADPEVITIPKYYQHIISLKCKVTHDTNVYTGYITAVVINKSATPFANIITTLSDLIPTGKYMGVTGRLSSEDGDTIFVNYITKGASTGTLSANLYISDSVTSYNAILSYEGSLSDSTDLVFEIG